MTEVAKAADDVDAAGLLQAASAHLEEAVIGLDGHGVVRYTNPAAALFGVGASAVGQPLDVLLADHRVHVLVRNALVRGTPQVRELDEIGGARRATVQALPVPGDPEPPAAAVALVIRDVSRLRHLETVRRDFVANVSHELRTPVTAIQCLVETLQGGALDDPDAASRFVARIGLEVSHMAQMVAELLELGAMESGAPTMHLAPTPVHELVAAAERLRPLADERGVEMTHSIDPGTPQVLGDGAQLGQVVRNLVHNAIKFTPSGGTIRLLARGLSSDGRNGVELRVSDTGSGMTADEVARVFERFYKVDRSRQRDGEGTGLGLAIARHVVEAHTGRISAESAPGGGSTFTVWLPAAP